MSPWIHEIPTQPVAQPEEVSLRQQRKTMDGINEPYKEKAPVSYQPPPHLVSMFFVHTFSLVFFPI